MKLLKFTLPLVMAIVITILYYLKKRRYIDNFVKFISCLNFLVPFLVVFSLHFLETKLPGNQHAWHDRKEALKMLGFSLINILENVLYAQFVTIC